MSAPLRGLVYSYINVSGVDVAIVGGGYYGSDANPYFVYGVDRQTFPEGSSGIFHVAARAGATNGALDCTSAEVP